jgi:hypothetical protein
MNTSKCLLQNYHQGFRTTPSKAEGTMNQLFSYACLQDVSIIPSTYIKCSGGWSPTGSTRHGGHWLAYCSLPRVIMMMENLVEWRWAGETEVLGENPPQRHFVHHKSHLTRTWYRTRAAAVGSQYIECRSAIIVFLCLVKTQFRFYRCRNRYGSKY